MIFSFFKMMGFCGMDLCTHSKNQADGWQAFLVKNTSADEERMVVYTSIPKV